MPKERSHPTPEITPPAYNYNQAAIYTTFSKRSLMYAKQRGDLIALKNGRSTRFLKSDLDSWLSSLRQTE
jgi:hypothetical protein